MGFFLSGSAFKVLAMGFRGWDQLEAISRNSPPFGLLVSRGEHHESRVLALRSCQSCLTVLLISSFIITGSTVPPKQYL